MEKFKVAIIGGPDVDGRIELMHILSDRYRVFAIGTNKEIAPSFQKSGFEYYDYPLAGGINPFAYIASFIELFLIVRRERPQIVHTFDTKPSILGRLAARLAGIPVTVGTITGLGSLYIIRGELLPMLIRPVYQILQKLICELSDMTFFYTAEDAKFFLSNGLVRESKYARVPGSGVMLERFSPERFLDMETTKKTRLEIGASNGSVVITMVARLVRSKGVLLFAEIARRIKARGFDTQFVLIGPHDQDSLDSLTPKELNSVRESVQWIGARANIEDYLAITDVFVLPSEREGIPRVLVEAAAMSLPLVASDLPGCCDVIVDGENGYLVPPNNPDEFEQAIVDLMDHPETRRRFGAASRELVKQKYDLKKVAGLLVNTYTDLLKKKGLLNEMGNRAEPNPQSLSANG